MQQWIWVVGLALGGCAVRQAPAAPPSEAPTVEPPKVELVNVSHRRELRGGWIATVDNINWPSKPGLSAETQRAELEGLIQASADAGLNAIFFQIRPEADALYPSHLEPWSRYISGRQGADPGYDPLAFAIDACHARGIELHAWFNPYRAGLKHSDPVVDSHVAVTLADHVHKHGTHRWMDPGAPEVQDHTAAVIADVVERYDIDGVHFDDYFYPYPAKARFPDRATYQAHGNGLSLEDWRRANVDRMVERIHDVVVSRKPWVRFGISPFGIYRPGQPEGIQGFDQYAKLYADPPKWLAEGFIDYLAPQLYWPTTKTKQAYAPLLEWWSGLPGDGYTFPGNFLARLGHDTSWTIDEFRQQVALTRQHASGNIWFHIGPLVSNDQGIRDVFRSEFYPTPALLPPLTALADQRVDPPVVKVKPGGVDVTHPAARWWVVYRKGEGDWQVETVISAKTSGVALKAGDWVVTAAGRHGVESQGVRVTIP
ncbi:MAG: family 10 glycosylhydrolase [Myxococcota bacterium]